MLRATCAALALWSVTSAAAATKRTLAVVELATPPTMVGHGAEVTQQILESAAVGGFKIIPPDDVRTAVGIRNYEELRGCGGAPTCVANRLSNLRTQLAVVGSLMRDEKNYLLKLWLIDVSTRTIVADVDRPILIAARRFGQDIAEAVPRLLRGEHEARGTLKLTTTVNDVQVSIDGVAAGVTPLTVQLKPGKHEIRLEKKRYLSEERLIAVEANHVSEEEVRILLAPGQEPTEAAKPVLAATAGDVPTATPRTTEGSVRIPLGGWLGFGAGLVAGGVAIYFGQTSRNIQTRLLRGYDPARDTYQGTRTQALLGRKDAVIANVLFGVTGAAVTTGAIFCIVANSTPSQSVTVAPTVGPSGAGVLVQGRF